MKKEKPKVLLIDDDPALTDIYRFKFDRDGTCRFITATEPAEGIAKAKTERPDLILLDLIMPKYAGLPQILDKETGFWTLEHLKSDPDTRSSRVVIFTNLDEDINDNASRARFLGAEDYWLKAKYKPSEIIKKVKEMFIGPHSTAHD